MHNPVILLVLFEVLHVVSCTRSQSNSVPISALPVTCGLFSYVRCCLDRRNKHARSLLTRPFFGGRAHVIFDPDHCWLQHADLSASCLAPQQSPCTVLLYSKAKRGRAVNGQRKRGFVAHVFQLNFFFFSRTLDAVLGTGVGFR